MPWRSHMRLKPSLVRWKRGCRRRDGLLDRGRGRRGGRSSRFGCSGGRFVRPGRPLCWLGVGRPRHQNGFEFANDRFRRFFVHGLRRGCALGPSNLWPDSRNRTRFCRAADFGINSGTNNPGINCGTRHTTRFRLGRGRRHWNRRGLGHSYRQATGNGSAHKQKTDVLGLH